ncbi:MAG TPA: hypothetical protein VFM05_03035, partial [Candidatus Saccharimonadales bacterium]|nr:hypothetical protein [Candidatus Saccharimonadales bacterium]
EGSMNADLRTRYDAINAKADKLAQCVEAGGAGPSAAFGCSALLVEAMGRLENPITLSAPPVCVSAVEWSRKPLASYSIEYGGRGKHTVPKFRPKIEGINTLRIDISWHTQRNYAILVGGMPR